MNIQPIFSPSHLPPMLPKKSCAFCGSVFISQDECESCGRQFNKELLGAPGGEKSFYATQDRYRKDVGAFLFRFDRFLAPDAGFRVRYISLLKKRYMTLLDHFQRPGRGAIGCHAYLVEFQDLVAEMRRMKISPEYMYDLVELDESADLTHKLRTILNEEFSGFGIGFFVRLMRIKIAGGPRLGFITAIFLGYGGLCLTALWIFSYLAKR